eukprot:scaffold206647_cov46-Prasinocladus_malaysianus.AAC.1
MSSASFAAQSRADGTNAMWVSLGGSACPTIFLLTARYVVLYISVGWSPTRSRLKYDLIVTSCIAVARRHCRKRANRENLVS